MLVSVTPVGLTMAAAVAMPASRRTRPRMSVRTACIRFLLFLLVLFGGMLLAPEKVGDNDGHAEKERDRDGDGNRR